MSEHKFKVGDRVRIVKSDFDDERQQYIGIGTEHIIRKISNGRYYFDDTPWSDYGFYVWNADELELVNEKPERYRGELREGMRVEMSEGEHVVRRCNGEWRAYDKNGYWSLREEPKTATEAAILRGSESRPSYIPVSPWLKKQYEEHGYEWIQLYKDEFDITNSPDKGVKKPMAILKKATNLIKGLSQPLRNYVRLGWVEIDEDEYVVTEEGAEALQAHMFGLSGAKDMAEYAEKEVRARSEEDEE